MLDDGMASILASFDFKTKIFRPLFYYSFFFFFFFFFVFSISDLVHSIFSMYLNSDMRDLLAGIKGPV
jgi:hypothetical protein